MCLQCGYTWEEDFDFVSNGDGFLRMRRSKESFEQEVKAYFVIGDGLQECFEGTKSICGLLLDVNVNGGGLKPYVAIVCIRSW